MWYSLQHKEGFMMPKVVQVLVVMLLALVTGGCSENRWLQGYQPTRLSADALAAPGLISPEVRVVSAAQMHQAMAAEDRFLAERARTRQDASPRDQRELQRVQFPLLGLYNDPGTMMLMGTSNVADDEPISESDPGIAVSAKEVGASLVVVSVLPPPAQPESDTPPAKSVGTWRGVAWYYAPAR
jgi:hypothetical protein